ASFMETSPRPFSIRAAIRFDGQAQFHPRQYLQALAWEIPGQGSHVFEHTRVLGFSRGNPCTVYTERGELHARDIILASHFPLDDKALYALRLIPHQSYVLGLRLSAPAPRGTYMDAQTSHSVRQHPLTRNGEPAGELLLVGGEGHRVGEGGDTAARYRRLQEWACQRFAVQAVEYRWTTFDHRAIDGLPYIGRANPFQDHVYVATGFGGWGMSNSTAAALLLRDKILQKENSWRELFDPGRASGAAGFGRHVLDVGRHFIGDRLHKAPAPDSIGPDEGGIVAGSSGHVALYRDGQGHPHAFSPVCPHMGCHVKWNPGEKTWDCPCHGSRFDTQGEIISGPALKPLDPVDL
ncbi:MAG TPA: FAD-dependent oxidoreductase, partial [Moraxellaceae bacterium]